MRKILYINLKNKKVKSVHQYDEHKINLNNNNLVFEAPSLAGYGVVGLNKLKVYNKNSLSQTGGHFAHFMKCNGYDFLVFEGESDTPIYLYIDKESVKIKEASHLLDKDYDKVVESIKEELNTNELEIASIGLASVKKIDFSKIIFRNDKSCGKKGLGKLMADKNIKAIVLKKQENLIPYDISTLKKYNDSIAKKITNKSNANWYDENNTCYGCCLNCKNTSLSKIKRYGFSEKEARDINKISNFYGLDSVTLARGIDTYKKTFDTEIVDLENFIEDIINNYSYYKPLFINEGKFIKKNKTLQDCEKLGFCKLLMEKDIINDKDKKILAKSILGVSIAI
ncbi:aldehyde ferredoxin oxidoreductase N-terminal domain-containing protein [Romboutsia hominis]|uniref:aldehyde ferredoxin oxidoreductase N-terminal domain-containing protein n=1 Tax=Romboutsia hominis TaxID=1507512 RepID=UPI000B816FEE|nr:aldehyde ferredoxin oxidoreductase N-terminal domain-containing protein [Romboutsia hominis]